MFTLNHSKEEAGLCIADLCSGTPLGIYDAACDELDSKARFIMGDQDSLVATYLTSSLFDDHVVAAAAFCLFVGVSLLAVFDPQHAGEAIHFCNRLQQRISAATLSRLKKKHPQVAGIDAAELFDWAASSFVRVA